MKKTIRLTAITLLFIFLSALTTAITLSSAIPENFMVAEGKEFKLNNDLISTKIKPAGNTMDKIPYDDGKNYTVNLSLLGILPIKDVNVDVVKSVKVQPLGDIFGIKMFTDGVLVIGMNDVDSQSGSVNPAKNAGIRIGDIIISVNGKDIKSSEQLTQFIGECPDGEAEIVIVRDGEEIKTKIKAAKSKSDNEYRLGAWVRDSTAGIGTMTFYMPEYNLMAGLGHGICDVDTGEIMPLLSGEVVPVEITDIVKGAEGAPGEIKGSFLSNDIMGRLIMNTDTGVYASCERDGSNNLMEIAMKQEISEGSAQILSRIEGSAKYYEIEIEKVSINSSSPTRNMVIKITDEHLLQLTGGIIQGMSGSPIIQNGKLVGAVTHVFINDPTRGYGIFAENMLEAARH